MIPNFNTYSLINESISLKDLRYSQKSSYGKVKNDFTSKGYEFLGNITFKVYKFKCPEKYRVILDVVPDDVCDMLSTYSYNYVSAHPRKKSIYIHLWGCDDEQKLIDIFNESAAEDVIPCLTKKGDLYYALYNDDKKYFYFVTAIGSTTTFSDGGALGFSELFIKIRTSGVDEVVSEIDDLKNKYEEEQRLGREKREKEEEERKIRKEKEKEYDKKVELLQKDVDENPEKYEMVSLPPKEIVDALDSDDYFDCGYVEYRQHIYTDPYEKETVMCYVNDYNLTKGYKYEKTIDHSRPGQYWGD